MKNIKLTNAEANKIAVLLAATDSIINSSDKKLPLQLLWTISNNFDKLKVIAEKYGAEDKKIREKYMSEEYSIPIKDDNGVVTDYQLLPECRKQFADEVNELATLENELSISTIPFEKIENYEFSGQDLNSIKFMIEDPAEETE